MNVFNTILRSQQPLAQTGQEAPAGGNDTPWMITTAAKSIGSVAGVGKRETWALFCEISLLRLLFLFLPTSELLYGLSQSAEHPRRQVHLCRRHSYVSLFIELLFLNAHPFLAFSPESKAS